MSERDDGRRKAAGEAIAYYANTIAILTGAFRSGDDVTRLGGAFGLGAAAMYWKEQKYDAIKLLRDALANNDLVAVEGAYLFFIRDGKEAAIAPMIAVLEAHGDRE